MNLKNFISEISEPEELWVNIPDYEDLYMISTFGRILSKEKLVNNGYADILKPCRLLKSYEYEGRLSIILTKDKVSKKFSLSQLVASVFLPKPDPNYLLKFKDKNSLNCKVDNLIWCPKIDRHVQFIIEDLGGEIWKDVVGYEGYYSVSNKGRLKSLSRDVFTSNRVIHTQDRIMEQTTNVGGYYYVTLSKNGSCKKCLVHRLVALTFIDNPNNYPHVDHIDTNPKNNCVENLRWVTPSLNMQNETTKQNVSKGLKGKTNISWNCTPIVQLQGDLLVAQYPSIAEAERSGFGYSGIQKCLYKKQKTHKGYSWMYLSDYLKLSPQTISTTASGIVSIPTAITETPPSV